MGLNELMMAYECGIDYGLLLAEEERDSEDCFDAAGCAVYASRMCIPSTPAPRRRPRSETWRAAKRDSMSKFLKLVVEAAQTGRGETG